MTIYFDKLKTDITNKYEDLLKLEYSNAISRQTYTSLFNDLSPPDLNKSEMVELIKFTTGNFQMTNLDITGKYDTQDLISKMLIIQAGFFLSFYSFLISKHSFEMDEVSKEELVFWIVDIFSTLNLSMGALWQNFMNNFVLSFHTNLSSVLFDIYEILGLNIPHEIKPDDYNKKCEDELVKINYDIIEEPVVEKVKKVEEPDLKMRSWMLTHYDSNFNNLVPDIKRKSRKSSKTRRSKSSSKTAEEKEARRRKKCFVPQTPNCRPPRHVRTINLTRAKLKDRVIKAVESPIAERNAPTTPTMLRKLRLSNALTDRKIAEIEYSQKVFEKELSVSQASNDHFEFKNNSNDVLSRPLTRFKSRLFDSFLSPVKTNDSNGREPSKSPNAVSPRPKRSRPFFSPIKAAVDNPSTKSPTNPVQKRLFSPRKSPKVRESSPFNYFESHNAHTPLRSCLKSPVPDKTRKNVTRRHTTLGSVLLSPKIKQRSFLANQPSQDYCEDTMFMDTKDFIKSSGLGKRKRCHQELDSSPLPAYLNDASSSSTANSTRTRSSASSRQSLSVSRKLFDNSVSSDIDPQNIVSGPRRRRTLITKPNFLILDPETDVSNGLNP